MNYNNILSELLLVRLSLRCTALFNALQVTPEIKYSLFYVVFYVAAQLSTMCR
jgi:hypothetical protein